MLNMQWNPPDNKHSIFSLTLEIFFWFRKKKTEKSDILLTAMFLKQMVSYRILWRQKDVKRNAVDVTSNRMKIS